MSWRSYWLRLKLAMHPSHKPWRTADTVDDLRVMAMVRGWREVVLCDLDSTVANTSQRHHLVPQGDLRSQREGWIEFALACASDTPLEGTCIVLRSLGQTYPIFYVSGRSEEALDITLTWLEDVAQVPVSVLRLHNKTDPNNNVVYKLQVLQMVRAAGLKPVLMIDDWPAVCGAFEEAGVPTLCPNPRYDDVAMVAFAAATEE